MTALIAGLALGLGSSVHCAMMCGPLMSLLPQRRAVDLPGRGPLARLAISLWHHTGRIAVYVVLGALAGGSARLVSTPSFRSGLAIVIGTGVLFSAAVSLRPARFSTRWGRSQAAIATLVGRASARLRRGRPVDRVALGVLNGLLPCGLLYTAVLAAAGFGARGPAGIFMLGFGLGTVPALASVAASIDTLRKAPTLMRRAAPIATALVGLLLVARGLGVPGAAEHAAHVPGHIFFMVPK